MYASVERRPATTPSYASYVSAVNKKPSASSSKDTPPNRWLQSPHTPPSSSTSTPPTSYSSQQQQQPYSPSPTSSTSSSSHQKQPHLFSTTNSSGLPHPSNNATSMDSHTSTSTMDYTGMPNTNHQHHHHHQRPHQHHQPQSGSGFTGLAGSGGGGVQQQQQQQQSGKKASDGGWSRGVPEKGSGWRGSLGGGAGSGWKTGSSDGSEAAGTLGWGEGANANGVDKAKSPSGWFTGDSAPNRPSSIGGDGWGSKSSRRGPSPHTDKGMWGSKADPSGKGKTPSSQEQKRSFENGTNGMSMWGNADSAIMGNNWKSHHGSSSESMGGDTCSPDEGVKQNEPDTASFSGSVGGEAGHSQDSYRPITASPASFPPQAENLSLGSNSGAGSRNEYLSSGNFSGSHEGSMTGSEETTSLRYDSTPYSRVSPRNGAGTPIQGPPRSGGVTPTQQQQQQQAGGKTEGGDNCWGAGPGPGRGSTSSVNSVGSSSSWKGDGRNGVTRSNSPRKNSSRFDRTNSSSQSDGTDHPSYASNGMAAGKIRKIKPKSQHDYEDGLDSLQSEPSGWGELPSPRPSDLDNGTEFWGVPPDDLERQRRAEKASRISHSAMSSSTSDVGWSNASTPGVSSVEWGEEEVIPGGGGGGGGGVGPGGWGSGSSAGPASGSSSSMEQGPTGGAWGSFPANKDKMSFVDNVMHLMELGINRSNAEKLLNSTHNNLEMAVMIASSDNPTFDLQNQPAFPGSRKSHGKAAQTLTSPFGSSNSSGLGMGQESGSLHTPTTPGMGVGQQPVSSKSGSQNQQLKLLQMQQQYLLNQIPGSNTPNLPLNIQNYQQVLNQRLNKLQQTKQYLNQQLKVLGASGPRGGGDATTAHQINLKLQQNQQHISQINQQLHVLAQLSAQSDSSPKSQDLSSPMLGGPVASISRSSTGGVTGKGFGVKQSAMGRSHSTSGIPEEAEDGKGLLYNMQGLSLGSMGQSSARSLSRLHQMFGSGSGGGGSSDNLTGLEGSVFSSEGSSPFSPPQGGGLGVIPDHPGSNAATPTSAGVAPFLPSSGKVIPDIQEFKPGVPWQPRTQATEPAQLYSKQNSVPGSGGGSGSFDNFSVAQSPVYSNLQSPMISATQASQSKGFAGSAPGGGGGGSGRYMRSNSTGSGFYGANSSGFMGNKRLPSPSGKYAHYVPHGESGALQQQQQQQGAGLGGGGWNSSSSGSLASDASLGSAYGGGGGHVHTRTYYPSRNQGSGSMAAQSPVSQFPPGVSGENRGWKQQSSSTKHQQLGGGGGGRRMVPPSSLPPRAMSVGSGLHNSRSIGNTPLSTPHDVFGTGRTPLSAGPTSLDDGGSWGAAGATLAVTPGSLAPSPAVLPNPVWGAGSLATPDELSAMQLKSQQQWGGNKDDVSKLWNQIPESDATAAAATSAPSKPPGLSTSPDSSPIYMKMPQGPAGSESVPASAPEVSGSFATTPSFSSGSGTWGQDEIKRPEVQETLSPEPTFAEWQAGKKARLSVFKLPPSMPTSPWLVLRNVTKQIDSASLREVCGEYGVVRVCHTDHPSELALVCFNSLEEAVQAKTGLDKNPSVSGVSVMAQFASEGDIKELCEQFQLTHSTSAESSKREAAGGRRGSAPVWPSHAPSSSSSSSNTEAKLSHHVSSSMTPTPSSLPLSAVAATWNDNHTPSPAQFSRQQSSDLSTPGSMWSDGGFLSGFPSSPWLSSGSGSTSSATSAGGVNMLSSGPSSMVSPQEGVVATGGGANGTLPGNCGGQPFLPGGLL